MSAWGLEYDIEQEWGTEPGTEDSDELRPGLMIQPHSIVCPLCPAPNTLKYITIYFIWLFFSRSDFAQALSQLLKVSRVRILEIKGGTRGRRAG